MLLFYLSLVDTDEDRITVAGIYKRCYGLMTYVAEKTLGDRKDAAPDIVHDSMLKIIDRIGTLDLSGGDNTKKSLSGDSQEQVHGLSQKKARIAHLSTTAT